MTRLLAGSIIREMLNYGLPEDKLWPVSDTPAAIASKFPRDPSHTSQWIWDFHSYLEHECLQDRTSDQWAVTAAVVLIVLTWLGRREVAVFAHVVKLPDTILEIEDESAILVTVNTTLSILVPANLTRPATYLDIPFDRISNTKMSKSDSQSQRRSQHSQPQTTTPCCMDIALTESLGWSHLINHKARQASSIGIIFDYMPDAIAVNEALTARQAVSHDDIVSPSQLQYDPGSPDTETLTDRQDGSFTSEPATSMRVLQNIESDAITCMGDDEAHANTAELRGGGKMDGLQTERNTVLDSLRIPPQAEAKQNLLGKTNSVTAEVKTVLGSPAIGITHPPFAMGSPTQEERQVHTVDNRQQDFDSDPLNDSSSQGPKLKHLRDAVNPPALKEQNEVHRVKIREANGKGLGRNFRDHNGLLSNAGDVQSHRGDSLEAYTDTNSKQAPVARGQPQLQGASKARSKIVYGKNPGSRGSEIQKSIHHKVYEPPETLDQRGKTSAVVPAPEASMVAQPSNNETRRKVKVPINTSNISRPRPKPQMPSTQVLQHPSSSKAKNTRSPNNEEEQVDWYEDMISDHSSDNATPTRNKAAKQPDISTRPKKKKTARVQNKAVLPEKPATSQSTQKPRRAAAVKADMKIRGLADPNNEGPSPDKKTVVKNTVNNKSAAKTAPSPVVKFGGKPDISAKASNQVKKTATRPEKDFQRQPTDVRALATFTTSPTLPETSPSPDHRDGSNSDPLPAHAAMKLKNRSESDEDVALPIKRIELVKENLVEPDAVVPGVVSNDSYDMENQPSMAGIATEQHAMDHPPDLGEESSLDEDRHPRAESGRNSLRPQAKNTAVTLHQPAAIIDDTSEEDDPISAPSEVHSKIVDSRRPEKTRGCFSGVHFDSPGLQNQTSKLSHHKSRAFEDVDHGTSAFSEHLLSPSVSKKVNDRVTEDDAQKRSTKNEHGFSGQKLEVALSPIISLRAGDLDVEARSILQAAHGGKRFGDMGKEPRTTGRAAEHQTPSESKGKAIEKRRIDEEDPRYAKKSRVAGWLPHQDLDGAHAEIRTPKNNVPEVRRKPVVVHFEPSGPKYERAQAPDKSKVPAELAIPQSKQDQHSKAIQSNKRKPLDTVNGLSAMDDLPNSKRRKADHTIIQRISRGKSDTLTTKPTIHSSTGQEHRHSSQSSRVNEQGSPMPTVYSRKVSLTIPKVIAPTPKTPTFSSDVFGNEEYYNLDNDAPQIAEPSVPATRRDTRAPIAMTKTAVGRNTKHKPGSPNAPSSIIADMTAHRIQPSGQFVGIQTNDIVVPQNLQDPFVEAAQNRPTSRFIETLRKYTDEQKTVENVNDNGRHEDRSITTHLGGNDPDKTLLEEKLSEDEESSTASGSSSSSCSSESQSQADAEPSDDGSGSDSAWIKALRDDQRDIFEKLHEISHVDVCCHSSSICC